LNDDFVSVVRRRAVGPLCETLRDERARSVLDVVMEISFGQNEPLRDSSTGRHPNPDAGAWSRSRVFDRLPKHQYHARIREPLTPL
jgi:hypothetical protein